MAEIVLDRVSKRYTRAGPLAVRDFSMHVGDGEFVVLVGPSGCGKTTILRLIAGLEQPTAGGIRIGGRDMAGVSPRDRNIAMMFQDSALYPHMSVQQNIAFGLRMRGMPRREIDQRVARVAGMLNIADLLSSKPGDLSGGQRQRAALARALARFPGAAAMLFDEPLSNLDAPLRAALRAEIKSLHRTLGMTAVYVTHDHEDAAMLADRVVDMRQPSVATPAKPGD
jgi:multiple sugar transport system ATP-binding protein